MDQCVVSICKLICAMICVTSLGHVCKIRSCLINYKTAYMQPYTCSGIFHLCQREFVPKLSINLLYMDSLDLVHVTDVIDARTIR